MRLSVDLRQSSYPVTTFADARRQPQVINAYEADGFAMLLEAFKDAQYLERLTGLDKLAEESEAAMEGIDWDEESDKDN